MSRGQKKAAKKAVAPVVREVVKYIPVMGGVRRLSDKGSVPDTKDALAPASAPASGFEAPRACPIAAKCQAAGFCVLGGFPNCEHE